MNALLRRKGPKRKGAADIACIALVRQCDPDAENFFEIFQREPDIFVLTPPNKVNTIGALSMLQGYREGHGDI
jgi:hypothetical protein